MLSFTVAARGVNTSDGLFFCGGLFVMGAVQEQSREIVKIIAGASPDHRPTTVGASPEHRRSIAGASPDHRRSIVRDSASNG
jgi:hypothetical protein